MKTGKLMISLFIIILSVTFTMKSMSSVNNNSGNSENQTNSISISFEPTMEIYSTPEQVFIQFDNPAQEDLYFVVTSPSGVELMTFSSNESSGVIAIDINELYAMGGNGYYTVDMYSCASDGKKKVITGTVVIIRE